MSKLPIEYIKHICDEINFLIESASAIDEGRFMRDGTLQRAYSRSLEIIGEAAKNIPEDFKKKYSEIDWKSIAGMRDRLIHHYFGVDYEIVWDVVKNEIPALKKQIDIILIESKN